jgi:hypothetical protein
MAGDVNGAIRASSNRILVECFSPESINPPQSKSAAKQIRRKAAHYSAEVRRTERLQMSGEPKGPA